MKLRVRDLPSPGGMEKSMMMMMMEYGG